MNVIIFFSPGSLTLIVSHWSLSDSKSPQTSWTLLSVLADLSNGLGWLNSSSNFKMHPILFPSFW